VLEYGIDTPGDMKRLLDIVVPDIAILTTIDSVHAANFPNGKEDIEREKLQLIIL
jgi:UDP-N-acetylmuramyl pentapeptide synthase